MDILVITEHGQGGRFMGMYLFVSLLPYWSCLFATIVRITHTLALLRADAIKLGGRLDLRRKDLVDIKRFTR